MSPPPRAGREQARAAAVRAPSGRAFINFSCDYVANDIVYLFPDAHVFSFPTLMQKQKSKKIQLNVFETYFLIFWNFT